jgi:hypothetical protein
MKINSVDFSELRSVAKEIMICLENSWEVVENEGGKENFYILLDTDSNSAKIINENPGISLLESYTNSEVVGLYEFYIKNESYDGIYDIYSYDEESREWHMEFHGNDLLNDEEITVISESEKILIKKTLNPKTIYLITQQVLSYCG